MDAFCLVVDLLGFRSIIHNLDADDQRQRIEEWISIVKTGCLEYSIENHQLISDTLFASTNGSEDGLRRLIDLGRFLLEKGLAAALPLRGAISYGQICWDAEIAYGKAITEAYEHGEAQRWLGISCAKSVKIPESLFNWDQMVVYPVPMKKGRLAAIPAIVWSIPLFPDFLSKLTKRGLATTVNDMDWSWADKVQNTVIFRMYIKLLRGYPDYALPSEQFTNNWFPIDIFDSLIEGNVTFQLFEMVATNPGQFELRQTQSTSVSLPAAPLNGKRIPSIQFGINARRDGGITPR